MLEKVQADLVAAMKAQNKERTGALRMLKSALKNAEIELGKLDDASAHQVVTKLCKQRRESIEIFEKNGRPELAAQEKAELAILEDYLPQGMSEAEMAALVDAAVAETGATQPKQMGQVMAALKVKIAGQAVDNRKLSELVKSRLQG